MFKTFMGPVEEDAAVTYLRPETAQAMFVNFDNVLQSMRRKLPFGIAQAGRSFRNEITPGNFIFRTREFEQMEIEYFVNPRDTVEGRPADEYWHDRWIADCLAWFKRYGLRDENLQLREHEKDELAHYSKRTVDIEYRFPIGWSELMGIANRTDFDLKQHAKFSGKSLTYFDEERKEHVVPFVVEPAAGVDRALLAFLADAYREEEVRGREARRAPLPSRAGAGEGGDPAPAQEARRDRPRPCHAIRDELSRRWSVAYDDTAAIGRLYRRQDEVGHALLRDRRRADGRRRDKGEAGRRPRHHPRPGLDGADPRSARRADDGVPGAACGRRVGRVAARFGATAGA